MFEYLKAWLYTYLPMPKSEKGQDLAEYALLIGLIALAVVAAVIFLGGGIRNVFNNIATIVQTWAT